MFRPGINVVWEGRTTLFSTTMSLFVATLVKIFEAYI
jgi:hypothetical protein